MSATHTHQQCAEFWPILTFLNIVNFINTEEVGPPAGCSPAEGCCFYWYVAFLWTIRGWKLFATLQFGFLLSAKFYHLSVADLIYIVSSAVRMM